jgi:hypothetical protein
MARMIITYSEKHTETYTLCPTPEENNEDPAVATVEKAMLAGSVGTFHDRGWSSDPAQQPLVKVNGKLVRSVKVLP